MYAAGDCTGVFALASVAAMQGRIAMYHFLGDAVAPLNLKTVSSNVFTDPEIATVGYTQADVDAGEIDAVAVKLPLLRNPRAKMQGIRDGFVKIFCPAGHGHRRRRRVVAPRAERADPPHLDRGRQQSDGRTDRERVHRVSVVCRVDRRGRAPAAHQGRATKEQSGPASRGATCRRQPVHFGMMVSYRGGVTANGKSRRGVRPR